MNWQETWFKIQVVMMWVGIGLAAFIVAVLIFAFCFYAIRNAYRARSKKYVWDCVRGKYVKKEEFYK